MPYTVLSHTADTGIEATAGSFEDLMVELAAGMFSLMAEDRPTATGPVIEFEVEAPSREDLVVDVLSELLYRSEVGDVMLFGFTVSVTEGCTANVTASTARLAEVESTGPPIKAVTYHDLLVEETGDGWHGRVYFDV